MTQNTGLHEKVRRSWLMAPASQPERAVAAPKSNTDVVLLDLVEFVAEQDKPSAREGLVEIVRQVRESGICRQSHCMERRDEATVAESDVEIPLSRMR